MMRLVTCLAFCLSAGAMAATPDWITLYDGRNGGGSLDGWKMTGPGNFTVASDGSLESQGGMGLFYYAEQAFADFELEVEWKVAHAAANSGVFIRFPTAADPWEAVNGGYEVQIDDRSTGQRQTGGIYSFAAPRRLASHAPGEWNRFVIRVVGQTYQIALNGEAVTEFVGDRARRGFIGLQNHDPQSTTWFRLVRVRELAAPEDPVTRVARAVTGDAEAAPIKVLTVTATHGFRHGPAIDTSTRALAAIGERSEFVFDFTEDLDDLTPDNLARYDVLLLNNATLRVDEPDPDAFTRHLTFRAGDWRNFDAVIKTPERDLPGRLALSGQPPALTGITDFGTGASRIDDARVEDNQLVMQWDAGSGIGEVRVEATLTEAGFSGTLTAGENRLPVVGTTIASTAQQDWDVADPVTAAHRAAILAFVDQGGGLAVAHAGLDALYGWSAYRRLVGGGLFDSHPWTQPVTIRVEDKDNPATRHLGDALTLRDEIYVLDANPRWQSHVLLSLDNDSVGANPGPADAARSDFPISWLREAGEGRVFVTKLGHFPDVWTNEAFMQHFLQGLRLAARRLPGSFGGRRVKETIAEGVWPDDIAVDAQGNVWIAELRGKVHRYDAASGETRLIAELPTTDPTKIEHGLLGIEVDPAFDAGAPYVYLFFTEPDTFINTLARFTYADGRLDPSSKRVLLRVPTEPLCCHQAGDLEWGLDGTLFVSTGDTGMSETRPEWELSEERLAAFQDSHDLNGYHWSRLADSERTAQNLADLRGKILRINKDGTIPRDNPFFGQPGIRWEIYAYGLRNPYRFKVHPQSGALLIGVVGPDARYDYDEYNIAARGGENFGWPRSIGRLFYNQWRPEDIPNYVPPMWEYTYATGARSATVGPVYQATGDAAFPSVFDGKVFIYDWARRWIKWAELKPGEFTSDTEADLRRPPLDVTMPAMRLTNIRNFDRLAATAPISMELGPDGSLYVAEFDGFWDAGPNANVSRYRWVQDAATPQAAMAGTAPRPLGERTYGERCASCHQPSGGGVSGVFPPLAGTPRVNGDPAGLIDAVLNGLSGPLEVDGVVYNGAMAPWRDTLDDETIAAVLTYIRRSWGNSADAVTAADVAARR